MRCGGCGWLQAKKESGQWTAEERKFYEQSKDATALMIRRAAPSARAARCAELP